MSRMTSVRPAVLGFALLLFPTLILPPQDVIAAGRMPVLTPTPAPAGTPRAPAPAPVRDVCWSEPPDYDYGSWVSSEIISQSGLESEVANDFLFDEDAGIVNVRWWGSICESEPYLNGFNLRLYADDSGRPGDLLEFWIIPGDAGQVYEGEAGGWPLYRYDAAVTFAAHAQQRLWLSVQARDHPYPPQWGRFTSEAIIGEESVIRSEYFGFPDWTPLSQAVGVPLDITQELTCASSLFLIHEPLPPTETEGTPYIVDLTIDSFGATLDTTSVGMRYRVGRPGIWRMLPLAHVEGNLWRGEIPGQEQPAEISYYLYASDTGGNEYTSPPAGIADPYRFEVAWRAESFEVDTGGFIADPENTDYTYGEPWLVADPDGTDGLPAGDHTGTGSRCWVAGPVYQPGGGTGMTTLRSGRIDLRGAAQARLKYWRWFHNVDGPSGALKLLVLARKDGGSWTILENAEHDPAWRQAEFDLAAVLGAPLGMVELQFRVQGDWSEACTAALDDIAILAGDWLAVRHAPVDPTTAHHQPIAVEAVLRPYDTAIDAAGCFVEYTVNGGMPAQQPLEPAGGDLWRAILPGQPQPAEIAYTLRVRDAEGRSRSYPPEGTYAFEVCREYEGFANGYGGFVVNPGGTDTAISGQWIWGDPWGTAAQPESDHSSAGATCWVTGVGSYFAQSDHDVDGGVTTLQSPVYDLAGAADAVVKYWRWFSNGDLGSPSDPWIVLARNDGGAWVELENTVVAEESWVQMRHDLGPLFPEGLGQVELRFVAQDMGTASTVEAAIDDVVILADLGGAGVPEPPGGSASASPRYHLAPPRPQPSSGATRVSFGLPAAAVVTLRVFDIGGRLVRTLIAGAVMGPGEFTFSWDGRKQDGRRAGAGVYILELRAGTFHASRRLVQAAGGGS